MRLASFPVHGNALPKTAQRSALGVGSLDRILGGGLPRSCVHEVYAAEPGDAAAAAGFVLGLALSMAAGSMPLWLRGQRAVHLGGVIQGNGWTELGGIPDGGLLGVVPDTTALLRAAVDGLRRAALGAVIVEAWGRMRELDLTASRRLALAAEKSGVPLLLLRIDATPVPSAAQTRWQVAAAPSRALPGNAPGPPTFDISLLRQKAGPSGLSWRLEWDRDQRMFRDATPSGAVVSVPVHRPVAARGAGHAA